LSNLIQTMEIEVLFPRWRMRLVNHPNGDRRDQAGTFSRVPDGLAGSFSGGCALGDLVMPTLTLDSVVGPVTATGRSATRYCAAWILLRAAGWSVAGLGASDWYLVDRDEEWPQLSLRIVGFF